MLPCLEKPTFPRLWLGLVLWTRSAWLLSTCPPLRSFPSPAPGVLHLGPGGVGSPLRSQPSLTAILAPTGYLCLYMEKDELLGATLILAWVPNSRIQRQDEEALRYITPESSPVRKAPRPRGRRTQSSGAPQQTSPTELRPTLVPRDKDILGVAQSFQDAVHISSSPEDGEKLAQGLEMDGQQPAHRDPGTLSRVGSQDGTEEGREPRPEACEEEGSLELSAEGVSRDSSFDSDSDAFSSPFCLSPVSAALAESSSSVFLESESR